MATLQLGRCVLPDVNVDELSLDGDRVSISGAFKASSTAERDALVGQLAGYGPHNTDEPVVPLIVGSSSLSDGFVRVLGTSNPLVHDENAAGNRVPFSVELERVPGWQAPLFEILSRGALRTNAHGVTNGEPWVGVPAAATGEDVVSGGLVDRLTRDTADDSVQFFDGASDTFYDDELLMYVSAENYLDDAATIKTGAALVTPGDSYDTQLAGYRTVVGRQAGNNPGAFLLDNGLVRVAVHPSTGLLVGAYDGAGWDYRRLSTGVVNTGTTTIRTFPDTDTYALTVLRNSPEVVSIKLAGPLTATASRDVQLTLTLTRGSRFVEGFLTKRWNEASMGLYVSTYTGAGGNDAGSDITGGRYQSSNDATDGHRNVTLLPDAYSVHGTYTSVYHAAAAVTSFPFGHGLEITGSSAADPDRHTDLKDQYYAAHNVRQQIVAR